MIAEVKKLAYLYVAYSMYNFCMCTRPCECYGVHMGMNSSLRLFLDVKRV